MRSKISFHNKHTVFHLTYCITKMFSLHLFLRGVIFSSKFKRGSYWDCNFNMYIAITIIQKLWKFKKVYTNKYTISVSS